MVTWNDEFRPENTTIYAVFEEESKFSGPRTPKLYPDKVFEEKVPYNNLLFNMLFLLISFFGHNSLPRVLTGTRKGENGS